MKRIDDPNVRKSTDDAMGKALAKRAKKRSQVWRRTFKNLEMLRKLEVSDFEISKRLKEAGYI